MSDFTKENISDLLFQNVDSIVIVDAQKGWRASRLAGRKTIPCIVRDYTEQEISEIAIIENLQREDLNPIESAKAIKNLINQYNLTQDEVADKIGKSRPAVANTLRLLTLPEQIITLVEQNKLTAGHARTLLGIDSPAKQTKNASTSFSGATYSPPKLLKSTSGSARLSILPLTFNGSSSNLTTNEGTI